MIKIALVILLTLVVSNGYGVALNSKIHFKFHKSLEKFPVFSSFSDINVDAVKAWIRQRLVTAYHTVFFTLPASEMAILLRGEKSKKIEYSLREVSNPFREALALLLLLRIHDESDELVRLSLLQQYLAFIESNHFSYSALLESFERLVISQIFVQTQKLPFLLIQTPKDCGKCYKALNY